MPIHVLDDVTINQIAAGEVIERPSSALKELMENAFDAGATKIEAAFEEGGKTILKVTDNGCGITPEDLPLAMQRHATSKINSAEDLFSLKTMGFRGEALASIGAVSDLTLSSTVPGTSVGSRIYARGGELGPIEPCAPLPGTQIEIKNLFYNVPARQKFLKSTAGETAAIKKVFSNFALAHPHIQLTLRQDQKVIMQFLPQSFFKRSCEVLGVSPSDAYFLESQEGNFKIDAVLVHPKLNLATQKGLFVFVQGRPVQDKLLNQALMEGYRNLVLDHYFPQAVVSLTVPPDFVDVNVHPAKLQVKFQEPSVVFRFVSHKIKEFLEKNLETQINPVSFDAGKFFDTEPFQPQFVHDEPVQFQKKYMPEPTAYKSIPEPPSEPRVSESRTWSGLQVLGQLNNTYILAQSPKGLVIIDQHAAHERVLFERLKASQKIEVQGALLEDLVQMEPERIDLLLSPPWPETFRKWGLEYHARGKNILAISSRPAFLVDSSLPQLLEQVADQIESAGGSGAVETVVHDLWASMSCHGAIRAGKVMSAQEMKSLLDQMEEQPFSSFCPHGRPVSVQITHYDLEKLFKRIV